jgi:dTDP-4-dehydrorhamnose reductase
MSRRINVTGTLDLIDKLRAHDLPILWLSTDKVFDGSRPHVQPETPPNPVSEYGRQKAETEGALRERMSSGSPLAILRLARVVSPGMPLLMQWARSLAVGETVRAFHDMMMAPTPIALVSSAICHWLEAPVSGILQLTGPRDVSYAKAAGYLARKLNAGPTLVQHVSAYSAGLPEGSTARNTTLDSSTIAKWYGIVVPDVWDVVDAVLNG